MIQDDYSKALGANLPAGGEQVTLFIPSRDKSGNEIDQEYWTEKTLSCFGTLFRGATAFPPGKGVWRDDDKSGLLHYDKTVMVVSYVHKTDLVKNLNTLRIFLHEMGKEANQGEIGILINGVYYGISEYDKGQE